MPESHFALLEKEIELLRTKIAKLKCEKAKTTRLKKDGSPKKTGRQIEKSTSKNARKIGHKIEELVLIWTLRWGFVTDQSLQFLYKSRPRLGYDLSRRGWLIKHKLPSGKAIRMRDNSGHVYGLSESAKARINEDKEKWQHAVLAYPKQPIWTQIQHLLDLQRIAACYLLIKNYDLNIKIDTVDSDIWRSEPETRKEMDKNTTIPDFLYHLENSQERIEYEQNPKNDLQLKYWVLQLCKRVELPFTQANESSRSYIAEESSRAEKISKITIVVRTEQQFYRYLAAFNSKAMDVVRKNEQRKLFVCQNEARMNVQHNFEKYGCEIDIKTYDDYLFSETDEAEE